MERFIRQKYQHRSLADGKPKPPSRHNSGHNGSPEGSPPPLPPKSGKLFSFAGLRSSSSAIHLRRPSSNRVPASSPRSEERYSSSPANIGAHGFGASVAELGTASFATKLTTLREMGFPDDRRNAVILKGVNGDLERAVDSLVRLGEGSHPPSGPRTPTTTASPGPDVAVRQEQKASTNPFDQLDANPNQPSGKSYNPFDIPPPQSAPPQPQSMESSFQNLQVSQPLVTHSTGGYPSQHSYSQPLPKLSSTPPGTSTFTQGSFVSSPQPVDGSYNPFFQPAQQQSSPAFTPSPGAGHNNPFFHHMSPQGTPMQPQTQFSASTAPNVPQHASTMPALSSTSPFGQIPAFQQQPPQQQQPPPQFQNSHNPFQPMTGAPAPHAGYEVQFQQPGLQPAPQPLGPQSTGRMDKSSILALYNFSPPPPAISEQPQQQQQPNPMPGLPSPSSTGPNTQFQPTPSQQSAPQAVGGSRNPFFPSCHQTSPSYPSMTIGAGSKPPQPTQPTQRSHSSQPSVDVNGLQNGRHSPDAFASLSARYA